MPPESGKDGKDEDSKEEAQKDEAAKEKQDDSEKSAGEEKSQEETEEAGSKTDTKVRSVPCTLCKTLWSEFLANVECLSVELILNFAGWKSIFKRDQPLQTWF